MGHQRDGSGVKKIASSAADASWSPDGEHIAIATGRDKFGKTCFGGCQSNDEIYTSIPTAGSPTRLTKDKAEDSSPTWSPDGTQIAFVSDRTNREQANEIYVVDATGGEAKQITSNDVWDSSRTGSKRATRRSRRGARSEEGHADDPVHGKNAASSRRRSPGRTSACS